MIAKAVLTMRKRKRSRDTLELHVFPGFVELRILRQGQLRHAEYIPAKQWLKLLTWANQHPPDPSLSHDPQVYLERETQIALAVKQERRTRRLRSRAR